MTAFDDWFMQDWHDLPGDPRSADSGKVLLSVYDRWFSQQQSRGFDGVDRYGLSPAHVAHTAGIHTAHLASLLRFRLGAHDLGVAVGRWHGVSRADRMCNRCSLGCIDDEFHMVFECTHYNSARAQFTCLFDQFGGHAHIADSVSPAGPHMARFMHQDKRLVAAFVHACWLLRSSRAESLDMLLVPVESDIEVESDELLEVPLSDVLAGRD